MQTLGFQFASDSTKLMTEAILRASGHVSFTPYIVPGAMIAHEDLFSSGHPFLR